MLTHCARAYSANKVQDEFDKRNVKVIALSVDSVESHRGWVDDI
ncbi:MAG: redoxin domain-containing protein, partial [Candidatus Heimdallarchaeota archaeon]|nr:redoxin domain-containing protein [Candidatus Heimdallarchaeota archaeon]